MGYQIGHDGITHGGDIIGAVLHEHGVRHLFTLCGGHISPILVGAKKRGIEIIDMRGEANAVFAADAVARMTGIPGVAAVTAGPGVTNAVTAVKNAQMAQTPLLIFGGATATILKGRGSLQDIDQLSLMTPITKWATSVKTVANLGPTVEKALVLSMAGVPGPVFIEVPLDLLYPEELVRDMFMKESGADKGESLGAKALGLYLRGHVLRQFHGPRTVYDIPKPQLRMPLSSDAEQRVAQAVEMLRNAKRPALVVGNQTMVNCREPERIADAIRSLGIPTFLAGAARGLLGRHSDVQFRHKRSAALKEADVVVVAGFPFDFRMKYGRGFGAQTKVIAANLSYSELRKNRRPDLAVQMAPADFLVDVARQLGGSSPRPDWFAKVRGREDARDAEIEGMRAPKGELVNPIDFFLRLEEKLADDSVLVVDGGDFVATGAYILRPRSPLSWLDPGVFGTLGVGGGFGVGAAALRKDAEVWIIYGDGSSAYSIAEFDTCVRHGLAPIAVVGTDGLWAQIARDQVDLLGDDVGTTLLRTDYHEVAKGYGGVGLLLTDPKDIDAKLDEAKAIRATGKPVLLNVHIEGTDFRKGSISV